MRTSYCSLWFSQPNTSLQEWQTLSHHLCLLLKAIAHEHGRFHQQLWVTTYPTGFLSSSRLLWTVAFSSTNHCFIWHVHFFGVGWLSQTILSPGVHGGWGPRREGRVRSAGSVITCRWALCFGSSALIQLLGWGFSMCVCVSTCMSCWSDLRKLTEQHLLKRTCFCCRM